MAIPHPVLHSLTDAQENFDALTRQTPVEATALPASPVDGQIIYFVADATNGVEWQLRYNASSSSAYKWEFVGGSPLFAEVTTRETTASTTYAGLATAGPSITTPLAGDYTVAIGCYPFNNTVGQNTFMGYDIGGTGAVDADALNVYSNAISGGFSNAANLVRERRKTGLAAAALIAKYRVTGGTGSFESRWLRLVPIRVG